MLNDNREIVSELRHSIDPPYPQDGHPVKVEITAETNEVSFSYLQYIIYYTQEA